MYIERKIKTNMSALSCKPAYVQKTQKDAERRKKTPGKAKRLHYNDKLIYIIYINNKMKTKQRPVT